MKKKLRNRIIGSIIAAVIITSVIYASWYYTIGPGTTVPPSGGGDKVFDIVVLDGSRNEELDLSDVRANLYLLPNDAIDKSGDDWTEFENQTAIDTMNEIDESDLDAANSIMAVVVYWVIDTDIDNSVAREDQHVAYLVREARLYDGQLNTLYLYETMENGADPKCYNSDTMVVINTAAANITSYPCVNFTFTISATNMSAFNHHQMFVAYWSYQTTDWAHMSLTLTFNATCQRQELTVTGGLAIDRPSTTSLSYSWSYLDSIQVQSYHFTWHTNVTGVWPTSSDILIALATPPVLAFNGVAV